jgi:hypothetical protein
MSKKSSAELYLNMTRAVLELIKQCPGIDSIGVYGKLQHDYDPLALERTLNQLCRDNQIRWRRLDGEDGYFLIWDDDRRQMDHPDEGEQS